MTITKDNKINKVIAKNYYRDIILTLSTYNIRSEKET